MKLTDFIARKAIVADMKAKDKKAAVTALVKAVKASGMSRVPVTDVVNAILERERMGSTGIGGGVAIPHAKTNLVTRVVGAFGRCKEGVPFDAVDGEKVTLLFLILAPENDGSGYQQALQAVSKAIKRPNFVSFLRQVKTAKDIEDVFKEAEEAIAV